MLNQQSRTKTITIISLIIILILAVALLIYFIFFRNKKDNESSQSRQELIGPISENKFLFPILDEKNKNILFFNNDQTVGTGIYFYSLEDKSVQKISESLELPEKITWSPLKKQAALKYTTATGRSNYQIFNLETKKITPLNSKFYEINWLANEDKIIYQYYDPINKINNISKADSNLTRWEKIIDIDFQEGITIIPSREKNVYYYPSLTEIGGENIYELNIQSGDNKKIYQDNLANKATANKNGDLIFQLYHPQTQDYTLALLPYQKQQIIDLALEGKTEKVGFSDNGDIALAAINQGDENDKFYQIDLKSGDKKEILYQSKEKIEAFNLMMAGNKTLYFTSNDRLYQLTL